MRGPQAMMRTPLMMSHPPDPAQTNEIVAWRRLAAAGVWSSVNRRPSIHSANTQVPRRDQHVSGQESTGRDSEAPYCFFFKKTCFESWGKITTPIAIPAMAKLI